MRIALLCTALLFSLATVAQAAAPAAVSGTVQVAGLDLSRDLIAVTAEKGFTRILVDLYPVRKQREAQGAKFDPKAFAAALVKGPVLQAQPGLKAFRIHLVEYTERDDYALPVFSSMKVLWEGKGEMKKGKLTLKQGK